MAVILIDKYDIEANVLASNHVATKTMGGREVSLYKFNTHGYIIDLRELTTEDDVYRGIFICHTSFQEQFGKLTERSMKYRREIIRTELPDSELE